MTAVPDSVTQFCNDAEKCIQAVPYQQWGHELGEYPDSISNGVHFLQGVKDDLSHALKKALEQQQWGKLVVAFYGETNAGKSTLIETLCSWFGREGQDLRKGKMAGASIGDGRSDFTRDTTAYECSLGGQEFTLLDVPGIEGKEAVVQTEIDKAISTAHIVFFVTRRATPPQFGGLAPDGKTRVEGTLEKIRKHLRAEARVFRIYNKPVNSPRVLENGLILNAEEIAALKESDDCMEQELGKAYGGYIYLTALPAFFGVAEGLPEGSSLARKQAKFLAAMPANALLENSRFDGFLAKMQREILPQSKTLIEQMNMAKLYHAVQKTESDYRKDKDACLAGLSETRNLLKEAVKEYNLLPREMLQDSNAAVTRLEEHFCNGIRQRMQKHHENGLWWSFDSKVKEILEKEIKAEFAELATFGKTVCTEYADRSYGRIQKTQDRFAYLMSKNPVTASHDFAFVSDEFLKQVKIDTNHGLDWWGVGAPIGGVFIELLMGPVGWLVACTTIVGTLWSARKLLDSAYQEDQQRTAIEKVLNELRPKVGVKIREHLDKVRQPLQRYAEAIRDSYQEMENELLSVEDSIKKTRTSLERFCEYNSAKNIG